MSKDTKNAGYAFFLSVMITAAAAVAPHLLIR
jgi:hypothetical protein